MASLFLMKRFFQQVRHLAGWKVAVITEYVRLRHLEPLIFCVLTEIYEYSTSSGKPEAANYRIKATSAVSRSHNIFKCRTASNFGS